MVSSVVVVVGAVVVVVRSPDKIKSTCAGSTLNN